MGKVLVDGGFVSKSILPGSSRRGEVARERGGGVLFMLFVEPN